MQSTRHLLVRVELLCEGSDPPVLSALQSAVRASITELWGDVGVGSTMSTLQAKHYCAAAGYALVRTARRHAPKVRAALTAVRFVNKRPVRLTVVHAAGSQRTARRAMLRLLERSLAARARRPTHAALGLCDDAADSSREPARLQPAASAAARELSEIRRVVRALSGEDG